MKRIIFSIIFFVLSSDVLGEDPTIISRSQWGASRPKQSPQNLSINPPPFVVVHHTETPPCETFQTCKARVKSIQNYHMNHKGWNDIGYNFLIGGDGSVYEGRGWGIVGAHAVDYNSKSIGISIIGKFQNIKPPQKQLDILKNLISYGVSNGFIDSNYKLIGHRQAADTTCPGNKLYDEIKLWPHYDPSIHKH